MNRTGLIVLQGLGALTLLPYPVVLVANVMSIAAPRQTAMGALPFILLSLYPLVWIALWVASWLVLRRGAMRLAFGLSGIPALAGLAVVTFLVLGSLPRKSSFANSIAPKGSPLKVALLNLAVHDDGTLIGDAQRQQHQIRNVRALAGRGERLAADEQNDLRLQWRLKFALHDGPVTTADENPLVWRILTRRRDGVTPFTLRDDERLLISKPTALHGTPLYAALLQDGPDACSALIQAGARLSASEETDPAAAAALTRALDREPELRRVYARTR